MVSSAVTNCGETVPGGRLTSLYKQWVPVDFKHHTRTPRTTQAPTRRDRHASWRHARSQGSQVTLPPTSTRSARKLITTSGSHGKRKLSNWQNPKPSESRTSLELNIPIDGFRRNVFFSHFSRACTTFDVVVPTNTGTFQTNTLSPPPSHKHKCPFLFLRVAFCFGDMQICSTPSALPVVGFYALLGFHNSFRQSSLIQRLPMEQPDRLPKPITLDVTNISKTVISNSVVTRRWLTSTRCNAASAVTMVPSYQDLGQMPAALLPLFLREKAWTEDKPIWSNVGGPVRCGIRCDELSHACDTLLLYDVRSTCYDDELSFGCWRVVPQISRSLGQSWADAPSGLMVALALSLLIRRTASPRPPRIHKRRSWAGARDVPCMWQGWLVARCMLITSVSRTTIYILISSPTLSCSPVVVMPNCDAMRIFCLLECVITTSHCFLPHGSGTKVTQVQLRNAGGWQIVDEFRLQWF